MNILLVDDQQAVIDGLLVGINWNNINIRQVYQANNIVKAKEVIEKNTIDLMLCDIEMPMGNGLELFEWVVEKTYNIQCIFLTGHEDFNYIKKAMNLHGFDYLLQPAPYVEIEAVVKKAIEKIKIERMKEDYYIYGKETKSRDYLVKSQSLRDYLLEYNKDIGAVIKSLSILSIEVEESSECKSVLLQIFSWTEEDKWDRDLLLYVLENILSEMLEDYIETIVIAAIDKAYYYLLWYPNYDYKQDEVEDIMEQFLLFLQDRFEAKIAMYEGDKTTFVEQPQMYRDLMELSYNNVTCNCKYITSRNKNQGNIFYTAFNYQSWDNLIKDGCYDTVREEAIGCIQKQVECGHINQMFLKKFHQDYIGWFFHLLRTIDSKEQNFIEENKSEQYNYESILNSYTSVERMESLIDFTIQYIKSISESTEIFKSRIQDIQEYIYDNMEKNITRKELADAVYLNPEYLSRYFKREMGCTLTEFISKEKMKTAKALLENTKFSVSLIASKIGYSNFSYFAQCFKKEFGVSPSEYRLHKEEIE